MNNLLKVVLLILVIEIGVIIGANITKPVSITTFDPSVLNQFDTISLNEFEWSFNETIKDTQGLGLGKGIVQYKWKADFELGVNAQSWAFNGLYEDNIVYIDAPELIFITKKLKLVEKVELDAAKEERAARMLEQANKSASAQFIGMQKQSLSGESIYYQHAKSQLESTIKTVIKRDFPNLVIETIVIRNWP